MARSDTLRRAIACLDDNKQPGYGKIVAAQVAAAPLKERARSAIEPLARRSTYRKPPERGGPAATRSMSSATSTRHDHERRSSDFELSWDPAPYASGVQVQAVEHYSLAETVLTKTSELAAYFDRIQAIAEDLDCDVYWRGQADQSWAITSSLVRRVTTDSLTDGDLRRVEDAILAQAKSWMASTTPDLRSDLEWLAYLQHNWVPTRLLDFTPDPLVATFFACESLDAVDGRIFAVLLKKHHSVLDGATEYDINDTPSGSVKVFRPRPTVSPRLAAQSGVFLLGKLPSTHVNRWVKDELVGERQMLKDEVTSVMSLPFYFRKEDQKARATSSAVASYTARIHINKSSVRRELRREGSGKRNLKPSQPIDHAYCYPDVDGMRRFADVWGRVFPGTISL